MPVVVFLAAWVFLMIYVVVGNYLYWMEILPGLSRAGADGRPRFSTSGQMRQVEQYLELLDKEPRRPWFYGLLSHVREITAAVVVLMMIAWLCLWFEGA